MASKKDIPIYVIAGKDRFQAQSACEALQEKVLGKDRDLGVSVYDGRSVEPATVLDELNTIPFLAPRRVVVVDQADKFVSENRELLEKYFATPSDTGVLILLCETWRGNTRLAKALPKVGRLIGADSPKGRKLIDWVINLARSYDKRVSASTAQSLVNLAGSDTGRLANELEKLATYAGSRDTIEADDIEKLCGPTAEESIFLINDLIAEGRTAQALRMLDRLLRNDRSAEYSMVGVMAFSLRRLLKARALADAGRNPQQIVRDCGIPPFLSDRFMGQVRQLSTLKLKSMLNRLADVDYASKTGVGDVKLNLEKFIVSTAGG